MGKTLLYRIFGSGSIPKDALPQIHREGILLRDEFRYLVYFLSTSVELVYHGLSSDVVIPLAGSQTLIITDPTDPFFYYFGEIAGLAAGYGKSFNGNIPYEPLFDPAGPVDTDGDGTPDYMDSDSDDDGIPDSDEGGTRPAAAPPNDTDLDGTPDFRDTDSDDDGIDDAVEGPAFVTLAMP